MKRCKRIVLVSIAIILLSISFPMIVSANAAEPPGFTVIVTNPPEDLSVSLLLPGGSQTEAIELQKEKKAWETYYRFFYHMSTFENNSFDGAVLIVESREQSFQCLLPAATFKIYNNLLTLDMKTESITIGQSPLRVPVLVAMRVALTLLIEGIVFFLFGYRTKRSWLAFFVINLITQGWLNATFTGPRGTGSYWMISFYFLEIFIIIAELIAFIIILKEFKKGRAALYAIVANIASLVLGGLLIAYLPV
ncbi:MAG: hypothetical protein PHV32_02300 [Eubacteriales bacterium]|nr:hypothetical protein [Eubacteriales bacterium]